MNPKETSYDSGQQNPTAILKDKELEHTWTCSTAQKRQILKFGPS